MGQTKTDNPEKQATQSTQDEKNKKQKNTTCVGHHCKQTNINNLKKKT